MTVLGILSTTTSLKLALVSGSREKPKWMTLSDTLKFPEGEDGAMLHALGKVVLALLAQHKPDRICLLKVVGSQHAQPLEIRVKVEGLLQMLGARLEIPTQLVAPVSLRNQEKKFDVLVGANPEDHFNAGKKFKSVDLRSAVLTAWIGLDAD